MSQSARITAIKATRAIKDQLRSDNLIKCVYGYGMKDLSKLNSFEWDITIEDMHAREKNRIVSDIEYLMNMLEHHELCSVSNVFKYYELLCKQAKIKKEYGVNIPRKIRERMQDELDAALSSLDSIIIPGYEPEPTPKFTIGGVEVPESLGFKRENRGRRKGDVLNSSALVDFYYLINYVEPPVNAAEVEADRLIELEREMSKRGRGRPEGAKNKVKKIGKRRRVVKEKREGETRGRKRGSKNVKATAESDRNVVIVDKEIVVRKHQTYFEQHLFKYTRENREISSAEWMNHAEKELKKIMDSFKQSIKNFLLDWDEVNTEEVFWLKKFLVFKTRFNQVPYLEDHIRGWSDESIVMDDGKLNRNGLGKVTIDIYRKFLNYCTNESIKVYINTLISEESPSETLFATINEPEKIVSTRQFKRTEHDPNALNVVYLPAREGEVESAKNKIISSVNGIPIMSEYVVKRPSEVTSEMVESIKNIPDDKRVFLPKRLIVKKSKGKGKRQWKVKKESCEDLSEDENYEYNYVRLNEPVKSFVSSMNDLPPRVESKLVVKNTVRHIPKVDDPIFGHMDKYVTREKYVPVKLASEKLDSLKPSTLSPLKPFVYGSRVITIKEDMLKSKTFKKSYGDKFASSPKVNVYTPPSLKLVIPVNSKSNVYTPPSLGPVSISRPVSIPSLSTNSNPLPIPTLNMVTVKSSIVTSKPVINIPIQNTVTVKPAKSIIVQPEPHVNESIVIDSHKDDSKFVDIINSDKESVTIDTHKDDSEFDDLINFNEELCTSSNSNDSDIDSLNNDHILNVNNTSDDDSSVVFNEVNNDYVSDECIDDDISEINNYDGEFLDSDLYDDLSENDLSENGFPDLINFDDDNLVHDLSVISDEINNNVYNEVSDLINFDDDNLVHVDHDNLSVIPDEVPDLINFNDDTLIHDDIYDLYDDIDNMSDNNSSLLDDNTNIDDVFNFSTTVNNRIEINIMENRDVDILIDFSEKDVLHNMNKYNDFNKCLIIIYMEMLDNKLW